MRIDYQKVMDTELDAIHASGKVPKLFLHACCAPCSSYCLEYLTNHFEVTLFFYNPNISPVSEYENRLNELERLVKEQPHKYPVTIFKAPYDPSVFYDMAKGHEKDPERGERCRMCIRQRLELTAKMAAVDGYDYFTTTLSLSPYKDEQYINELGGNLATKYGVKYLFSDFRQRNGFERSIELSEKYNLYQQNFCGCVFSRHYPEDNMIR